MRAMCPLVPVWYRLSKPLSAHARKLILAICLLLTAMVPLRAQIGIVNEPKVLPPQPDAFAITKNATYNVGLFTGTATASIPIYEIKYRQVNIPISLSYSSNGVKVDQIASRTGIDWALHAGGVITRTILDQDDFHITRRPPPANPGDEMQLATYIHPWVSGGNLVDGQADEYAYSFNGYSGKFILDENGVIRQLNATTLKIEYTGGMEIGSFKIITPDGVQYFFGGAGAREETKSEERYSDYTTTGWYLKEAVYPSGDVVYFGYQSVSYNYFTSISQQLIRDYATQSPGADCGDNSFSNNSTVKNRSFANGLYLTSISTNSGLGVSFHYSPRADLIGDVKLDSIIVGQNGVRIRQARLNYAVSTAANNAFTGDYFNNNIPFAYNRLFLIAVTINSNLLGSSQRYEMAYNDINGLPPRLSAAQDHFGYFNGKDNDFYVPALNTELDQYSMQTDQVSDRVASFFANRGGNKEPDATYAVKGTLSTIKYPTGGITAFDWEANTINKTITVYPPKITEQLTARGTCFHGTGCSKTVSSMSFSTNFDQTIKLTIEAADHTADPVHSTVLVYVKKSGGGSVYSKSLKAGESVTANVDLDANEGYWVEMTSTNNGIQGYLTVVYRIGNAYVQNMNIPVPGLRVRKTADYDPVSNKWESKYYYYSRLLDSQKKSTGMSFTINYLKQNSFTKICETVMWEAQYGALSSSSNFAQFLSRQNNISYEYVSESIGENYANGGIEHWFYASRDNPGQLLAGVDIPEAPWANNAMLSGTERQTDVYKKTASGLVLQERTENIYDLDSRKFSWYNNFAVQKKVYGNLPNIYAPVYTIGNPANLGYLNIVCFPRYTSWVHLDTTRITRYEGGNVVYTETKVNKYDNADHQNVTAVHSRNSAGDSVIVSYKYPQDRALASNPVLSTNSMNTLASMVTQNMLNAVFEEEVIKVGVPVAKTRTDYKNWYGNFYAPELLSVKRNNNPMEVRLRYHQYDDKGNVLEYSKENGQGITYIWDYQKTFPVAETQNASAGQVAYTSFEADGTGGWTTSGTILSAGGITGEKSFNGTLTKTVSVGNYIVRLWVKTGTTATVNASSGILLITKNSWELWQWDLNNVSSVYIIGTNIDEVSLFPAKALMQAYTYKPFIGPATIADPSGKIVYYQYDVANRLHTIRDMDQGILKQYDYKYEQEITACANTTPDWQPLSVYKCEQAGPNNNFTGNRLQQQIDMNNCSATYLQLRWVNVGAYAGCVPVPNCTGPDRRVVNNACEIGFLWLRSATKSNEDPVLWQCVYYYKWSDGYEGPEFIEYHTEGCAL